MVKGYLYPFFQSAVSCFIFNIVLPRKMSQIKMVQVSLTSPKLQFHYHKIKPLLKNLRCNMQPFFFYLPQSFLMKCYHRESEI